MTLSPEDRQKVIELAAARLVEEMRREMDLAELITLPLAVVSQITGLGAKQCERVFATKPMGSRRRGVSLKAIQNYQSKP